MCGICGIIQHNSEIPSLDLIKKMIGSLHHRGPDSSGFYRDRMTALGHSRLAIIDLESGAQPLSNEDETLWITFNGEIFNYIELRDILIAKGHFFKTKSDTETIVHAWEEWGPDCFSRFNGQWAFAIWDKVKKELILSRDRHGIRPLYYSLRDSNFLFGSEIKAIFCDRNVTREFDPAGMTEVFTFWSPLAPRTVYKDILELQPGHYAVLKNGKLKSEPYWKIDFEISENRKENEYIEELREKLIEACRLRFTRSDVPVGAYLSGGIDSSITSALVAQYTDAPLNTFSLRFEDSEFDEGPFQKQMADLLGTSHHNVSVSSRDIGEIFPDVIMHTERPILRTAPAPLYLLSSLVREAGYKVVVTGEGADEVFGGYDIFREAYVRRIIAENPKSEEAEQLIGALYPWMKRSPGKTPAFAKAFFSSSLDKNDPFLSHRTRWSTTSGILSMFDDSFREGHTADNVISLLQSSLPGAYNDWAGLQRDQWLEYTTLLSGYILSAQGDRMLMANSVEGRFPFLDPVVVDFANKLPSAMKLKILDEKYILKEAFSDTIPEAIIHRPKQPYRAPDAQSFFFDEGGPSWLQDVISPVVIRESGLFNESFMVEFFKKCRKFGDRKMSNTDNMRAVGIISTLLNYVLIIKGDGLSNQKIAEPAHQVDLA